MDNITISKIPPETEETQQPSIEPSEPVSQEPIIETFVTEVEMPEAPAPTDEKMVVLTDINVTNQNVAFNILISFITVAQKRGTFSINESAKIWECLKYFLTPEQLAGENSV
jgi:hypothetical protein